MPKPKTFEEAKAKTRRRVERIEDGFKPLWLEPAQLVDAKLLAAKDKFDKVFDYWQPDMKRLARNCRMYWGVDYSQYASEIATRLLTEYRQPFQANIIAEKVETILSQTLQNPFDMTFKPVQISPNTDINELSNLAVSMLLEDKAQANWRFSQVMAYLFALVQESCEEMVIDYKRTSGLPKIMFKPIDPLYYRRDPNWETMDPWDMREFWKFGNMTVEAIMSQWPEKKDLLEDERTRQRTADYGIYKGAFPSEEVDSRWGLGKTHRVIEYSYLVDEERWWEYDLRNNRPFPETGHKNQSPEDIVAKKDYIQRMGLNPGFKTKDGGDQSGDIEWVYQSRRTEKKQIFAPTLSLKVFFDDGDSEIQINRISKFPLGLAHFRQQFRGVVDALTGPQEMLNRTEMNMADILSRSARDSFGIDKAAVDPEDRAYWTQNWNTVGFRGFFSEGYLRDGGKAFEAFPQGTVNNDQFHMAEHMIELADIVGKTPAAGHGRLEQKQTSGKLFNAQYQAGLVASGLWYHNIEQHERDKAQAWLKQAPQTYAGPEREYRKQGTNERFRINERIITDMGEIRVKNNISELPEQSVIITPAPQGTTFQDAQRELLGYFMQNTTPEQAMLRTYITGELYKLTPNLTDEKKEEMNKIIDMQMEVFGLDATANKLMLQGKIEMLKQQLAQTAQPQGMGAPPGPPGMGGPEQGIPEMGPPPGPPEMGGPETGLPPGEARPSAIEPIPQPGQKPRGDVQRLIQQMGPVGRMPGGAV